MKEPYFKLRIEVHTTFEREAAAIVANALRPFDLDNKVEIQPLPTDASLLIIECEATPDTIDNILHTISRSISFNYVAHFEFHRVGFSPSIVKPVRNKPSIF